MLNTQSALAMKHLPEEQHKPTQASGHLLVYLCMFLLPLAAGLFVTIILPQYGFANKFGGTGHDGYLELARSLYYGEGYRFSTDGAAVFHRPPLYPALLMPFMGIEQPYLRAVVVTINSLFLLMACVYTRRICALLFPQAAVGTIAMVLLVCNPWMIRLVSSPLSAVMQMALYSGLCYYFLQFCDKFRQYNELPTNKLIINFFNISILTTALCLAHGTSIYICAALFVAASLVSLFNSQWKLLGFLMVSAAITLSALSPWAMRNEQLLDRVELSSSGAGFTYFLGNSYWGMGVGDYEAEKSIEVNALRMAGISDPKESMLSHWGVTDPAIDSQLRDAMIADVAQNPTDTVKKSLLNLSDIFFPITHTAFCQSGAFSAYCEQSLNQYQQANRWSRSVLMFIIVGLALGYLLKNRTQKPLLAWVAFAGALLHVAPYLPIATYAHHGIYSLGALPILCALAAAALYQIRVRKALRTATTHPERVWYKASRHGSQALAAKIRLTTESAIKRKRQSNGVSIDHIIG